MKRIQSIFALIAFTLAGMVAVFAQGLEVSPVRLDFSVEPGANQAQVITVRNTANKRTTYTLAAADWHLNERGDLVRVEDKTFGRSCKEWMSFNPALVELDANESRQVTVTMNVPSGQAATKWAIVYVAQQKEQQAPQADRDLAMGIEVNQALGIFITQSPTSNNKAAAKLTDFKEVSPDANGARVFHVRTENLGDKIIDCNMYMVVSDLKNATERKLEPITFKVLPESSRIGELSLPADLDKGAYYIAAILDYGPNYPLEGVQMKLDIK
mgnify:CR=1 FL=1